MFIAIRDQAHSPRCTGDFVTAETDSFAYGFLYSQMPAFELTLFQALLVFVESIDVNLSRMFHSDLFNLSVRSLIT